MGSDVHSRTGEEWPCIEELGLTAHETMREFARHRLATDSGGWTPEGASSFRCRTGEQISVVGRTVRIDAGGLVGLSFSFDLCAHYGDPDDPNTIDKLLADCTIALSAEEVDIEPDLPLGRSRAFPSSSPGSDAFDDLRSAAVAGATLAAALQRDPERSRVCRVTHPFGAKPAAIEIHAFESLDDFDIETSASCQALLSRLPRAHQYEFAAPSWQAAAARVGKGQPRFGWAAVTPRQPKPFTLENDPISILRAISEATAILKGAELSLEELIEDIDLSDADGDALQVPVNWTAQPTPSGRSPIDALFPRHLPVLSLPGHVILDSTSFAVEGQTIEFRRRRSHDGATWSVAPHHPGISRHEADDLVSSGVLDRGRGSTLVLTQNALHRAISSRLWNQDFGSGPILPGMRIPGADVDRLTLGWIVLDGEDASFHPLEDGDSRAQARRRLLTPRRGRLLFPGHAIGGGAWLNYQSAISCDQTLPAPWDSMALVGWEMAHRTMEAVHVMDVMKRDDPSMNLSRFMRTPEEQASLSPVSTR